VLTEPKNALGKQYKKMFQMNGEWESIARLDFEWLSYSCCDEMAVLTEKLCKLFQVKLHFTENALRSIAKKAISKNTGARGLRSILENVLVDAMYEIPDIRTGDDVIDAVVVDEEAVGSMGCGKGAKILYGKGALDRYLTEQKNDSETRETSTTDHEADTELPSIVASM
ncbi:unnamed protein product, partial [Sphenostylis stenocarpa]